MQQDKTVCPHCNQKMNKWKTPPLSTWSAEYFYVCFNDACPYYVKGWKHMDQTIKVGCSYRHRWDPDADTCGPLPVWAPDAGKDDIIPE
ncbi:MAG: ogr/Delta-like zinc finger family protein [Syntrophobacteraceae bacterium]